MWPYNRGFRHEKINRWDGTKDPLEPSDSSPPPRNEALGCHGELNASNSFLSRYLLHGSNPWTCSALEVVSWKWGGTFSGWSLALWGDQEEQQAILQGYGTPHFSVQIRILCTARAVVGCSQPLCPDSHSLWKAEESQAVLCICWLSTFPAPLGCGALAGVSSLLSAASDRDTHRTAVVSHSAAWWVLAAILWCLQMSVPQGVILGIMKVGSILSQKPILICLMLVSLSCSKCPDNL